MTVYMPGDRIYFTSIQANVGIVTRPPDSKADANSEKFTFERGHGSFIPDTGGIWGLSDGQQITVAEKLQRSISNTDVKLTIFVQDGAVLLIGSATYEFMPDFNGNYLFNGSAQQQHGFAGTRATFKVPSENWGANVPPATTVCSARPQGSAIYTASLASTAATSPTVVTGPNASLAHKLALQDATVLNAVASLGGANAARVKAALNPAIGVALYSFMADVTGQYDFGAYASVNAVGSHSATFSVPFDAWGGPTPPATLTCTAKPGLSNVSVANLSFNGDLSAAFTAALANATPSIPNEDPCAAALILSGGFTKAK